MSRKNWLVHAFSFLLLVGSSQDLIAKTILSGVMGSPLTLPLLHSVVTASMPMNYRRVARYLGLPKEGHIQLPSPLTQTKTLRVAFLGDSLSRDIEVQSPFQFMWDSYFHQNGGAMMDASVAQPYSVIERLSKRAPIEAWNFATNDAGFVDDLAKLKPLSRSALVAKLANRQDLSEQVNHVLQLREVPDIIIIWLGHNDASRLSSQESLSHVYTPGCPPLIAQSLAYNLSRLYSHLIQKQARTAIVVFGPLVADAFKGIREQLKGSPTFQRAITYFPGYRDENFKTFGLLLEKIHREIHATVHLMNKAVEVWPSIRFFYSDVFRYVKLDDPSLVSDYDGIHPRPKGQNIIADQIVHGLEPALTWLEHTRF